MAKFIQNQRVETSDGRLVGMLVVVPTADTAGDIVIRDPGGFYVRFREDDLRPAGAQIPDDRFVVVSPEGALHREVFRTRELAEAYLAAAGDLPWEVMQVSFTRLT